MKLGKILSGALALTMALVVSVTAEAAKKRVAVMNVGNNAHTRFGQAAADQLNVEIESAIVNSGAYEALERGRLQYCLRELGLQNSGVVDGNSAIEFGKMTGAQYSVFGNVVSAEITQTPITFQIKGKIRMQFKLVDNMSGSIVSAKMLEGTKSISTFEADKNNIPEATLIHGAAVDVSEKVRRELIGNQVGTIAAIQGEKVYIDLGSSNGIKEGDVFIVYKEGKPIFHPIKKTIIGVTTVDLGEMKVIEVQDDYAAGTCKLKNGAIPKEGMKVKGKMKK